MCLNPAMTENGNLIATSNAAAEKFGMKSLQRKSNTINEDISAYGILDGSRYVQTDGLDSLKKDEIYISNSCPR